MIRLTEPADTQSIITLAAKTAVFKPLELVALEEVLCDYFALNKAQGHRCVTYAGENGVQAFAYFAPAAMTDRTWYLWWIAVSPDSHSRGIGSQLLQHVEAEIREQQGRLLLVETSSLSHYEPARNFYAKHGYAQEATIRGYYASGDDMVVFSKAFG